VRYALISDIHGNLEALEAVLADVRAAACDRVGCLGDIVGYGADPNACVERVREIASVSLLGNHDAAATGIHPDSGFNEIARRAIRRTRVALSESSAAYIRGLPLVHDGGEIHLSHAHPVEPQEFVYVFNGDDLSPLFDATTARILAFGHTHIPGVGDDRERVLNRFASGTVPLLEGTRYVMNVGSVGQPRDHDPRAAWGLLDLHAGTYEQRRVAYDVEQAAKKILRLGLPPVLAERLVRGL
jgi:predicted phosphodiesterase